MDGDRLIKAPWLEVAAVERNMSLRSRTTILSTKTMTSSIEMGENSIEEEGDLPEEENEQVFSEVGEQNNQKDNIALNSLEIGKTCESNKLDSPER